MQKPGVQPGSKNELWTAGALACDIQFVCTAALGCPFFICNAAFRSSQTKYETTLTQFFCAATKKSVTLCRQRRNNALSSPSPRPNARCYQPASGRGANR